MVLDQIQDHVTVTDLEGKITFVNRAEMTTFRRAESEIVGSSIEIYGEDPARGASQREIVAKTLRDGIWRGEVVNFTGDGVERIMDCRTQTVLDESGTPVALCGIATDITDRVRAEQEQKRLQDQLQQAIRVEAVGRLAGGIAHDFNNMLGVIIANTELALERVEADSLLAGELGEILKAARHSANLTGQLLTFARKQTIAPQVLDVNETVTRMLKMLRRLIGEDVELIWRPAEQICVVRMDPSQVDQTLTNLCVNARDAICGVGTITIETRCLVVDEAFCRAHPEARPGEFVELTVCDSGCGMDSSLLVHLFEQFFTTKELGSGTGLGLATVDGIVRQNDGFITVASRPGEGTTFRIYFPRFLESPPVEQARPKPAPAELPGKETILLVEDEGALLRVARRILERLGYTVLAADNPVAAMALARDHQGPIDLLVTDIIMPQMNGRELSTAFLQQFPDARCVFMSGYTADVIASHGVLPEDVLFLQKPFTPDQLGTIIRVALDRGKSLAGG
jgi:PAS domain S-box-containing protein